MIIKKDSKLYNAIYEAVYEIFDAKIELIDPEQVTEEMVAFINKYLKDNQK